MKKTITFQFLLLCFLVANSSLAQLAIGPKIGLSIASISDEGEFEFDNRTDFQFGIVAELGGSHVAVQPELTYIGRGFQVDMEGTPNQEVSVAYVDLGALLKIKFGKGRGWGGYLGAGPFFNYAISGKYSDSSNEDIDIDFERDGLSQTDFTFAGALGVSYDAGLTFFFDVRYMFGITDLFQDDGQGNITNINIQPQNRTLGLSAGVLAPL